MVELVWTVWTVWSEICLWITLRNHTPAYHNHNPEYHAIKVWIEFIPVVSISYLNFKIFIWNLWTNYVPVETIDRLCRSLRQFAAKLVLLRGAYFIFSYNEALVNYKMWRSLGRKIPELNCLMKTQLLSSYRAVIF